MTAIRFTNRDGVTRYGRYRISPQAGIEHLDDATAKGKDANYLFDELTQRIAESPIRFDIHVQIADESDIVDDATIHWPGDRRLIHFSIRFPAWTGSNRPMTPCSNCVRPFIC